MYKASLLPKKQRKIWNLLLTAILGLQLYAIFQLSTDLKTLKCKVEQNQVRLQDKAAVVPKKEHLPHGHYLKNIATRLDDPQIPLYPDQEYSYDDFESIFELKYLGQVVVKNSALEAMLNKHDIYTDEEYLSDKETKDNYAKKFKSYLEQKDHKKEHMERYAVKWASKETGFGLFAKVDIQPGEIIGIYTGVLHDGDENTDFTWYYASSEFASGHLELGVDSLTEGNYFRFVNHHDTRFNVICDRVPYNNRWHYFYIAVRPIQKGQQLLTHYGDDYFESRSKN